MEGIVSPRHARRYTPAVPALAGIDLAWTAHNESGVCIVRGEAGALELVELSARVLTVPEFAALLGGLGEDVVAAIDAPLIIGKDRTAERLVGRHFGRYKASAHSANAELLVSTGRDAGPRLAAALQVEGFSLDPLAITPNARGRFAFEVYPHAAHVCWFELSERIRYKRKPQWGVEGSREGMRLLQGHLRAHLAKFAPELLAPLTAALDPGATLVRGRALKKLEDQLDAITCTLAALRAWRDGLPPADVLGEGLTGYVAVPGLGLDRRFRAVHAVGDAHAHEPEHAREADLRGLHQTQPGA